MKLLALCSSPTRTGATAPVAHLMLALTRHGHEVRLCHDRYREGDLAAWCAQGGLPTDGDLTLSTVAPPPCYLRDLLRLARRLRRERPDAVFTTETNDLLLAVAARRFSGWRGRILAAAPRPPRPGLRGLPDFWLLPGALSPSEWGLTAHACLNSGPVVELERFSPPDRAALRRARRRFGFSETDIVVGWVGRFKPGRGVFELLEAFRRVAPEADRLRLLLAGFGEELPLARWWLERAGLCGRVCLAGFQDEGLPACYHAMNGLVLPAVGRDGLGRAGLEALACGLWLAVEPHPVWRRWALEHGGIRLLASRDPAGLQHLLRQAAQGSLAAPAVDARAWLRREAETALARLERAIES